MIMPEFIFPAPIELLARDRDVRVALVEGDPDLEPEKPRSISAKFLLEVRLYHGEGKLAVGVLRAHGKLEREGKYAFTSPTVLRSEA